MEKNTVFKDQLIMNYLDLKVVPTYHCDMNCSYCYNKYIHNKCNENVSLLLKSLSEIICKSEQNVVVELIGGEPLSRHGYAITNKILDYIISLKSKKIRLVLQTGSPNLNRINKLINKLDGISYSIDISLVPKYKNQKRLEGIMNYCNECNMPIQIQTILSAKDTINDINKFIELCSSQGVKWLGICYPDFQTYSHEELNMQANIYTELIENLDNFKNISIGGMSIQSITDFLSGWSYNASCNCGDRCLTIQPDGHISPCLFLKPEDHISLDTFMEVKHRREKMLIKGKCKNCEIWNVCRGGCMIHAKFLTGDINSRDENKCYLIRRIINKIR